MTATFDGFSRDFFTFFREIAEHNDREWFAEHKPRYQENVLEPLRDFVEAMGPRLLKISKHFVADPRTNRGSIFRIYRDIRFSHDKRPYKEHASCQFRHRLGRDAHSPGFYVHLAPDEVFFGGGVWMPPSDALATIREAIRDKPKAWATIKRGNRFAEVFGGVSGTALTRPPRGFSADDPHIEDIKRKSFFALHASSPEQAQSKQFIDEVEETFAASAPMMAFLAKALGVPF
ncbi:MAG TPA: DUF2461 domain-containing protein [Alphaproteobacteria bacterium]|nr:DUF2461 domain-containing protein [Alphaproteobacteria bacterium]